MDFKLLDIFKNKKHIVDLRLSRVLLEDSVYPWILLIPMRNGVYQMNQLSELDSVQLMKEINLASDIMEKLFETDQLNVASIGNKSRQLHIHIICRKVNDPLWPETVWGHDIAHASQSEIEERIKRLKMEFQNFH